MADSETTERLRAEFHGQTARIDWHKLQVHYARGAVIEVAEGLDLVEVAVQLQLDNTPQFEAWIEKGQVVRVDDDRARDWFEENPEVWSVVAPPWVLVQLSAARVAEQ